ncbi:amino acid adenylation domain-containing protein [Streptomyces sp. NPDC056503]|uniref:hybrid non-ribosomal peptide synthetase/type I polyketide synthase n=1 Tax=Streptomyces sp. NPDC056503 TaxID=3345842 RepID=UPI0036A75A98
MTPDSARTAREGLIEVWRDVLGVDEVDERDNFFELGGDSLLATRVCGRLKELTGISVAARDVFLNPTFGELADVLGSGRPAAVDEGPAPAPDRTDGTDGDVPSVNEEQMWFLHRLNPEDPVYNGYRTVRVTGPLDLDALEAALTEVRARHEILRTTYVDRAGRPTPVVHTGGTVRIDRADLSGLPRKERDRELDRRVRDDVARPFALSELPLERWSAYRLAPEEHLLVVVAHHIVHDSLSFSVVVREAEELYNARLEDRPARLAPPRLQYRAYARAQRRNAATPEAQARLDHWKQRLAGTPGVLNLPTDRPRPARYGTRGGRVVREPSPGLLARCAEAGREESASTFMVLYTALAATLHRYSGDTDLCVGTPMANRPDRDTEGLVGMVMNTVALRATFTPDTSFRTLLRQARDTVLDAAAHQECPLPSVVDALGLPRTPDRTPLFQSMITVHDHAEQSARFGTARAVVAEPYNGTAKTDLSLILVPPAKDATESDTPSLIWEYNADLFDAATVEEIAGAFEELLGHALDAPDTPVGALRLADDGHVAELLRALDGGPARDTTPVHHQVLAQARRTPARTALVEGDRRLTYGELADRAARLADALRAEGAGRGTVVAVCLPTGADLVLAELAVLLTGAAFLPVDPEHPAARARTMTGDAAALAVVTTEELRDRFEGLPLVSPDRAAPVGDPAAPAADVAGADDDAADDLAYIMFTSGSTGRPKGVRVPHRALANLVSWYADAHGLTADDRASCVFSPGFDATQVEIWPTLVAGATLHFPDRATLLVPEDYRRWIAAHSLTVTTLPVALATPLLGLDWAPDTTLRLMVTGGERLTARPRPDIPFRLRNVYGPTETTVLATIGTVAPQGAAHGGPAIGRPAAGVRVHVVDAATRPVPAGAVGELYIGGTGVADGYLDLPEATAERFLPDAFTDRPGARLYRTGDLVRMRRDGEIEFIGRADEQVKLRGHRIEPGEIESVLRGQERVRDAHVLVREAASGAQLVAYVVLDDADAEPVSPRQLRAHVAGVLPAYMVPAAIVPLPELPLTLNGKIDVRRLPAPETAGERTTAKAPARAAAAPPAGGLADERALARDIAALWCDVLGLAEVDPHDTFFDLGGHSLLLAQVHHRLAAELGIDVPLMTLFEHTTVAALAAHLSGSAPAYRPAEPAPARDRAADEPLAVVGMAGRFPGAPDIATFWRNLREGVESITPLEPVEEGEEGLTAFGLLEGAAEFDAAFFGYAPREALLIDPQQRVFLEVAHTALEDAGHVPDPDGPSVGIFAGGSMTTYYSVLQSQRARLPFADDWEFRLAAGADHLTTRAAHKLGLSGPAVTVATACSTSLTAIHLAAQSLKNGDCDIALAGGAGIRLPLLPVRYSEGGPFAREGHVRAFDADASGIVGGSAAAVVVLKRLSDALAAGDHVHAVLRGSAVNNDAGVKIGFTAPSIEGQTRVIRAAHAAAGVAPSSIGYVETHGTGTPLGDPIEVAALNRAFGGDPSSETCYIGSVKTNIGHTDSAAGVVGFIKTVLTLEHGEIAPSLNYARPNPQIDFAGGPFEVNTELRPWHRTDGPRRAAVTALGIGGTNVHVVLEQPPVRGAAPAAPTPQLLPLSAKTARDLDELTEATARRLDEARDGLRLDDAALTLQRGRKEHAYRRFLVADSTADAARTLADPAARRVVTAAGSPAERPVAFMFPGQGGQHPGMTRDLYARQPEFRRHLDEACDAALDCLGLDLRGLLFPREDDPSELAEAQRRLHAITVAQPAVFAVEYALARLWRHWGIEPSAVVGHSLGAYAAACVAGVFTLADGMRLVGRRGQLLQTVEAGAMLAVKRPEEEVLPLLPDTVTVGAVNGPGQVTVSGPEADIDVLAAQLADKDIDFRKLRISGAGHSPLVEPILEDFHAAVAAIDLRDPDIPFVSDTTGTWARPGELTDPAYWTAHMRQAVRYGDALTTLLAEPDRILVEVGPGMTLTTLTRQHPDLTARHLVTQSQPHPTDPTSDHAVALDALGRLWLSGARVDWSAVQPERPGRRRAKLPGHPLHRTHYLVEAPGGTVGGAGLPMPPEWMGREAAAEPAAPAATPAAGSASTAEQAIAGVFRDLLGLDDIAPADSLFDLGGDSVVAARLAAWIRDTYPVHLETREIFAHPTVAALAALVDDRTRPTEDTR